MRHLNNQKVAGRKSKAGKVIKNLLACSFVISMVVGCIFFFGYQLLNKIS